MMMMTMMMKVTNKLLLTITLALCFTGQGFAQTLRSKLRGVSQIEHIKANPPGTEYGFKESYTFTFKQPIDHQNPGTGSFKQFGVICFQGFDKPTVLYTRGYEHRGFAENPSNDLADNLDANVIYMEHRYYGKSKVSRDPQWKYLTIRQACDDLHAIFQALKPILPESWVSTGTSKDGNTAVFYSYFYPDDMNAVAAFCAPFQTTYLDERVGRYVLHNCGTEAERARMHALLNRMLPESFYEKYAAYEMEKEGISEDECTSYTSYVKGTLNTFFSLFADYTEHDRALLIPSESASDETLLTFRYEDLDDQLSRKKRAASDDEQNEYNDYLYTIQCLKEYGTFTYPYQELKVLEGTAFDRKYAEDPLVEEKDEWLIGKFDGRVSKAVLEQFLPTTHIPILLVYSHNDPWTAGKPTKVSGSVKILINKAGGHDDYINDTDYYMESMRDEIVNFISSHL